MDMTMMIIRLLVRDYISTSLHHWYTRVEIISWNLNLQSLTFIARMGWVWNRASGMRFPNTSIASSIAHFEKDHPRCEESSRKTRTL